MSLLCIQFQSLLLLSLLPHVIFFYFLHDPPADPLCDPWEVGWTVNRQGLSLDYSPSNVF